ncbi:MAG TPA: tetratricopeptide repeat protein [Gemmatimonadales bacterium]|jgi:hypothetical protein|nr:tetratricopeptide repeat protein [Gemmatimonadales bacterium]
MHRPLYLVGVGYLAICGVVVLRHRASPSGATAHGPAAAGFGGSRGGEWFAAMKPYCNSVEVELAQRQHPPPATLEGQGLSAACYALGGKIDRARGIISELPARDRYRAVGIVFDVAHPVADAGDDRSAGPIMELVVEYWPNHYMALYHAGMSEYALGQSALARTHLESFLSYYHENDGWTRNARDVLARLR